MNGPALKCCCLCAMFFFATTHVASAQNKEPCYMVVPTSGNALGSILVDRCTGKTWILVRTDVGKGTAVRWWPISTETGEAISPR